MTDEADAAIAAMPVSALIGDDIVRIAPGASLEEAADAMVQGALGALVVGFGAKPDGVISERDILRAVADRRVLGDTTVSDYESTKVVWCDVEASAAEVAGEMMDHYVRHVLVEDDGDLVGVVSARDILGIIAVDPG